MGTITEKHCASCGESFCCGADSNESCWCVSLPPVAAVPDVNRDCFCSECLTRMIQKENQISRTGIGRTTGAIRGEPLVEGEDYYLEGEKLVFTSRYLLRRGYCCESGCRHCPYDM